MSTKTKKVNIRRSLSTIGTKAINVERLLDTLYQKQLIDDGERDRIHQLTPKAKKFSEMYILLVRKGSTDSFEVLHDALIETGNGTLIEMLQAGDPFESGTFTGTKPRFRRLRSDSLLESDVRVQEDHVKKVARLIDETIAHAEWPSIASDLLDSTALTELDNLPPTTPYEILFEKTLLLWVQKKGPEATVNTLIRILNNRNQGETAESVALNHKKIFGEPAGLTSLE